MITEREQRLVKRVHEATSLHQLIDLKLCDIARKRAKEQLNGLGHVSPLLSSISAQGIGWGEVLGYNRFYRYPIHEIVDGWMASPEHRRIITDPSYPVIGAGVWIQWWSLRWYFCVIVTTGTLP